MITEITIKNCAFYREATLYSCSRNNLIYGLNGTGKTVLSEYLRSLDKTKNIGTDNNQEECDFTNCEARGYGNEKVLVFNEKFIEDNLHIDQIKGIFTISETNKNAEIEISRNENRIEKFTDFRNKNNENQVKEENKLKNSRKSPYEKMLLKIWEIKTKYAHSDYALEFCFAGLQGNKETLYKHLHKQNLIEDNEIDAIDKLVRKAKILKGEESKIDLLSQINPVNLIKIENTEILKEKIVGNKLIPIAELIDKLQNFDWVGRGRQYMTEKNKNNNNIICPFCQKDTIDQEIEKQLTSYFDGEYKEKIKTLKALEIQYKNLCRESLNIILNAEKVRIISNETKANIEIVKNKYINICKSNLEMINYKIQNPASILTLESHNEIIEEANLIIQSIISQIKTHNKILDDTKKTKNEIKEKFWKLMRSEYSKTLREWEIEERAIRKLIVKFTDNIKRINNIIDKIDAKNLSLQSKTKNTKQAVSRINKELKRFGLNNFSIKEINENHYRIVRKHDKTSRFKTLSEGEKMIIGFLYFIELCQGYETKNELNRKKIIVIDDPISSLSHPFVYEISQYIINKFCNNEKYEQIFITTHSLFFFHELVMFDKPKISTFRIYLDKDEPKFKELEQDDILNDYEMFWCTIREYTEIKCNKHMLANAMRNILEHFFVFVGREKIKDALKKISTDNNLSFKVFIRYMNRQSHSDGKNISDHKEIDDDRFLDYFKSAFECSGYIKHYNKYMRIED